MASQDEIKALKEKIELQLKSNALSNAQKANLTSAYNAISGAVNELEKYRSLSKDISVIIDDIADSLDFVTKSFAADVAYLTKGRSLLNDHKSAMSKLANIAKETLDIRLGEQAIDEKRFKKLQEQAKKQIDILKSVKDQYISEGKNTDEIQSQIDATEELRKGFSKVEEINNKINKQLGVVPKLAAGIDKALSKLGLPELGFKEALDETRRLGQEADSVGNKNFSAWKTYTGIIWNNFKGIFTTANLIQAAIGFLIDALKSVDSGVGELAKGLDMSYNSANNLRMELTDIANFSGDAAVNTKGLQESLLAVGTQMGINARLSEQDLVTFTKLREQAGYTNDELVAIQKISTINNKTVGDTSKAFLGTVGRLNAQNKLAINAKQLFKEIVNVSDAIKLSVGGTAEKIAEAAFKAKQFGITLQQADNIAESLLNFESSIANELSAELITGKDLNFERARLLAINGDIAGASAEILKQVGGTAEFTKMNRIQQEAIAKSVGMTRDDLAKSLVDREAAAKLGAQEGQAAQDRYNELVKQYGVEKANAMLGDEALARQFQQQSVQERFAQSIEKLKEVFISLVEPLMPVFDIFADIMGFVAPIVGFVGTILKYTIQWGKYLLPIIAAYKTLKFLGDAQYRTSVLINFSKKTGIASDQVQLLLAKQKEIAEGKSLMTSKMQEYYKNRTVASTIMDNIQKRIGLALDNESLLNKIKSSLITAKDFVIEKASLAFKYTRNTLEAGYNALKRIGSAIAKSELLRNIGSAAMKAIQSLSSIPVIGWALGLAAAGTVAALGYKYMKGDDVMSEGGYGNRTLLTPKGSIALNNNDTVIAGTNLGGKGKSNPAPAQQDLSPLLNEMKALRQEQAKSNSKPTVVENSMNGTKFGTSVAMNTYKIQ